MTKEQYALDTGTLAVLYGMPLVIMEHTLRTATNVAAPHGMAAPLNQLAHVPRFPAADFKQVVRANVDTLYSSAFLDLSKEPLVLSAPDTHGRYYLFPMFDAWTNVFASPGTRTTGNAPRDFVIVGPGWEGALPPGLEVLRSPTNMAWILGRIQTDGPEDYAAVHAVQAGFRLTPLSAFGAPFTPPKGNVDPDVDMTTAPVEKVKLSTAIRYFEQLARLLGSNPPPPEDAPVLARLATIGIIPGEPFDPSKLEPSVAAALEGSVKAALTSLDRTRKESAIVVSGWGSLGASLGRFGTDYIARALIAWIAFGANLPADAVYPTAFTDSTGEPLRGANRYVLRFEKGLTPPVRAFWSVTLYDADSFFADNPIHRFAISSWMPLKEGPDGAIEIYVQHDSPGDELVSNWLPAPEGKFNLTLRMYWPRKEPPSLLDASWAPPPVTKRPE